MSLMTINQFMSPYDELREVLVGESEFAALLETFIRMGLAAIEERMPNATIDAALDAMKPEIADVIAMRYGIRGKRRHSHHDIADMQQTGVDTARRREGNGILALRKAVPFRRGE